MRTILVLAVLSSVAVGCGSPKTTTAPHAGALKIVAGENFWGSIATQLVGTAGTVTSIVTDPNADPHDYESSVADARAFADADYVILNGAGYDAWAQKLIAGNPNSRRRVLTVADLLHKKEGDNPHFWYNPDFVTTVTAQIQSDLTALAPSDNGYFTARRVQLDAAFAPVRSRLTEIKAKFAGTSVGSTESIFVYLADYLGLRVVSPPSFMDAVAEGNDPPAPSVVQFQTEIADKQMRILVFNEQTVTDVTTTLEKQAAARGIPVVGVTETIQPSGLEFEDWFAAQLLQLEKALGT